MLTIVKKQDTFKQFKPDKYCEDHPNLQEIWITFAALGGSNMKTYSNPSDKHLMQRYSLEIHKAVKVDDIRKPLGGYSYGTLEGIHFRKSFPGDSKRVPEEGYTAQFEAGHALGLTPPPNVQPNTPAPTPLADFTKIKHLSFPHHPAKPDDTLTVLKSMPNLKALKITLETAGVDVMDGEQKKTILECIKEYNPKLKSLDLHLPNERAIYMNEVYEKFGGLVLPQEQAEPTPRTPLTHLAFPLFMANAPATRPYADYPLPQNFGDRVNNVEITLYVTQRPRSVPTARDWAKVLLHYLDRLKPAKIRLAPPPRGERRQWHTSKAAVVWFEAVNVELAVLIRQSNPASRE